MATQKPSETSGSSPEKEVSTKSVKNKPSSLSKWNKIGRRADKISHAIFLVGALDVASAAISEGCNSPSQGTNEHTGNAAQALTNGWNPPTTPNIGISGQIAEMKGSGTNVTLYVVNSGYIWAVGTTDGTNWNSPIPTKVSGIDTLLDIGTLDIKICGNDVYVATPRDGITTKLNKGTLSGGAVINLQPVPGTLNSDGYEIVSVTCNSDGTQILAKNSLGQVFGAEPSTWIWQHLSTCDDPGTLSGGHIFLHSSGFYQSSNQPGTKGNLDNFVQDTITQSGKVTGCLTAKNIDDVSISDGGPFNNANQQGSIVLNGNCDNVYSDNGTIKQATAVVPCGSPGTGGAGGAPGTGGSPGTGGTILTGGSGGTIPTGGQSPGGAGGVPNLGGNGGTGTGGTILTGGSAGNPNIAGNGGTAGAGGIAPDCSAYVKVTAHPEAIQIESCSIDPVYQVPVIVAHVSAEAEWAIGNKTFKVLPNSPSGTFNFTFPNLEHFSEGVEFQGSEPITEGDKIVDTEGGLMLGYVGTIGERTYPDRFNPYKTQGIYNIVAFKTIEGGQMAYDPSCVPVNNSVTNCTPFNFFATGSTVQGLIPAGITMYYNLKDGTASDVPPDEIVAPPPTEVTKGCHCATIGQGQTETQDSLAALGLTAGLAFLALRRRKGFTNLESEQE